MTILILIQESSKMIAQSTATTDIIQMLYKTEELNDYVDFQLENFNDKLKHTQTLVYDVRQAISELRALNLKGDKGNLNQLLDYKDDLNRAIASYIKITDYLHKLRRIIISFDEDLKRLY